MQIRTRLSFYFAATSAVLSLLILAAIYFLYSRHTNADFFVSLKDRATVAAQVYLEADEISGAALQHLKEKYLVTLPQEVIKMYDSTNQQAFIYGREHNWPDTVINRVRRDRFIQYAEGDRSVVGIRYDDNQGVFVVLVSAVDKAGTERKQGLLRIIAVLYLAQIVLLFFIGRWFAKKALDPVSRINRQVQRINATDLHLRVNEGEGKDEISELGINFNRLLDRLEASFELQKTFVANASHELRTPLTSIIGELEVALAQARTSGEWKNIALSVLGEANQLTEIIEALLNLAGTESAVALQQATPVRVDELLWELQDEFKRKDPPGLLDVKMDSLPADENELCIVANRHLLLVALHNIVRNAFKFSYNQPVTCILRHHSGGLMISVRDTGIGIRETEPKTLFRPFYRDAAAASFEGKGMGLFIAKKIIDLSNGQINIISAPGKGTTVNISFTRKAGF